MKKNGCLKLAVIGFAAMLCVSGQSPRKEVQMVPEAQCVVKEADVKKPEPVSQKSGKQKTRRSAAQRAMEADASSAIHRKSAAQRAIETEKTIP